MSYNYSQKFKSLARKLIRVDNSNRKAIDNEARVVSAFLDKGGHPNLIKLLGHGWLHGAGGIYYVDMELGNITLVEYIRYHHDLATPMKLTAVGEGDNQSIVWRDSSELFKVRNLFVIGIHIAQGLSFMHDHKYVHRDLKPSNGKHLFQFLSTQH